MTPSSADTHQLPLPIAHLVRRARNAKSPKERHDTAYFAWEASIRLAVAARPPEDTSALALPSIGHWVRACSLSDTPLDTTPLLSLFALLSDVGSGKKGTPKSITPRKLIDALPAYRNQVLGHGSVRSNAFYDDAATALFNAVAAAWSAAMFLPGAASVVYVEGVEVAADGTRRGRTLSLAGLASSVEQTRPGVALPEQVLPKQVLPDHVLPQRLYVRAGDGWRSLHPWLLFQEDELRERVWFFNARKRSGEYLDYTSGELLKGKPLTETFPHIEDDLEHSFGAARGGRPGTSEEKPADPDQFGDYRILGKLGEGGMGVVYLARQTHLDRLVALKMLPPALSDDATAAARFQREIAALSRCDHPNVVKILASGEARGTHYYAMEYIEGADLSQVATALSRTGDLTSALSTAADEVRKHKAELFADVPEVRSDATPTRLETGRDRYRQLTELIRDAARGLHHLHDNGILHRDIKPANLMLTADDGRVVLMDLGLAAVQDASRGLTKDATSILGTLRYMAPEQLQRSLVQVDRRADIFALGASLWELLTDKPLRDGDNEAQLVEQVLRGQATAAHRVRSSVPADLSVIAGKATEPDPKLRYDTAEALADDLDAWLDGRPITARPPTLSYLLRLWVRRHKAVAATAAAAMLIILAGTAAFIHGLDAARRSAESAHQRADEQRQLAQTSLLNARATALSLASQQALASGFSMRALLLAREAVDLEPSFVTYQSLRDALGRPLEQQVLRGHDGAVGRIGFTPKGDRIVTFGQDGTARVWDESGQQVAVLDGQSRTAIEGDVSPDGRHIVTADRKGTVRVWGIDGELLATHDDHEDYIAQIGFSDDGTRLLTASHDGKARVRDLEAGSVQTFEHDGEVVAAWFAKDGDEILTVSDDESSRSSRIWRTDGKLLRTIPGDAYPSPDRRHLLSYVKPTVSLWTWSGSKVWEVTGESGDFFPDGKHLLIGAPVPGRLEVYALDGRMRAVIQGHTDLISNATFSPSGDRVVTASWDRTARLWTPDGTQLAVLAGHEHIVFTASFTPDGSRIVSGSADGTARVWLPIPREPQIAARHDRLINDAGFDTSGKTIVTASADDTASVWTADGERLATLIGHTDNIPTASFSPDGRTIVTASWDGTARLWDTRGRELAVLRGHEDWVVRALFSPDGKLIATASDDGTARVWSRDGELVAILRHDDKVHDVGFSPDGTRVVTASDDKTARVWDRAGNEMVRLEGHDKGVGSAIFSPAGNRLLTGSRDDTARLWDLDGNCLAILHGHDKSIWSIAFSPDQKKIATTAFDRTARLWDLEGRELAIMRHDNYVYNVEFSPSGDQLVTASRDGAARLWTLEGELAATLRSGRGPVTSAHFSPDGHHVITTHHDGMARFWLVSNDDLRALAEELITRDLSDEERTTFGHLLGP